MNQRLRRPPPKRRDAPEGASPKEAAKLPELNAMTDFRDRLRPWVRYFALFAIAFAFFIASRIDAVRPTLAFLIAMAFPAFAVFFALSPIKKRAHPISITAHVVGVVAFAFAAGTMFFLFYPPVALGTKTLTLEDPTFEVNVPRDAQALTLQMRGKLQNDANAGEGTFELEASRGGTTVTENGRFFREIGRSQRAMSRSAPSRMVVTHEIERAELALPNPGPVRITLKAVTGGIHHAVRVSLFTEAAFIRFAKWIAIALLVLSLLLEMSFARTGAVIPYASGVAAACVFAVYMAHQFDPDDALGTVGGGAIVAMGAGLIAYFVAKWSAGSVLPKA